MTSILNVPSKAQPVNKKFAKSRLWRVTYTLTSTHPLLHFTVIKRGSLLGSFSNTSFSDTFAVTLINRASVSCQQFISILHSSFRCLKRHVLTQQIRGRALEDYTTLQVGSFETHLHSEVQQNTTASRRTSRLELIGLCCNRYKHCLEVPQWLLLAFIAMALPL